MAVFTYTQSEVVLGKLTNGKKIVHMTITPSSAGVSQTTITCQSLQRIDGWTIGFGTPATDTVEVTDGTIKNQILITPSADSTSDVYMFLLVGV